MQLSAPQLEKYVALESKHFGDTLDAAGAHERATKLLTLFKLVRAEKNPSGNSDLLENIKTL